MSESDLTCRCGAVRLRVSGRPILAAECHCASCARAAKALEALPDATPVRASTGGTPYVLYRKDRVTVLAGADHLAQVRLTPESGTRRIVATCCNTGLALDFAAGHWLSLYGTLWPETERPPMDLRTMTKDRPADAPPLPADMPNPAGHTAGFMARLLWAWVAMGFRSPKVAAAERELKLDV